MGGGAAETRRKQTGKYFEKTECCWKGKEAELRRLSGLLQVDKA